MCFAAFGRYNWNSNKWSVNTCTDISADRFKSFFLISFQKNIEISITPKDLSDMNISVLEYDVFIQLKKLKRRSRIASLAGFFVSAQNSSLTLVYHHIVLFFDTPSALRVLAIDFANVFDKMKHSQIIKMTIRFCLPRYVSWLIDYLLNRRQRVRHAMFAWCNIPSGVPQGSVIWTTAP